VAGLIGPLWRRQPNPIRGVVESMKAIIAILLAIASSQSFAACRWVLADHDGNKYTPERRVKICDEPRPSIFDVPKSSIFDLPKIQKIQPINRGVGLPPLGATKCEIVWIIEDGNRRRLRVCS